MKHLGATANQFNALGDEDRLALIVKLIDGPQCVGALSDEFGVGMSTISQRLKILYQARLVTSGGGSICFMPSLTTMFAI